MYTRTLPPWRYEQYDFSGVFSPKRRLKPPWNVKKDPVYAHVYTVCLCFIVVVYICLRVWENQFIVVV